MSALSAISPARACANSVFESKGFNYNLCEVSRKNNNKYLLNLSRKRAAPHSNCRLGLHLQMATLVEKWVRWRHNVPGRTAVNFRRGAMGCIFKRKIIISTTNFIIWLEIRLDFAKIKIEPEVTWKITAKLMKIGAVCDFSHISPKRYSNKILMEYQRLESRDRCMLVRVCLSVRVLPS